MPVIPGVAAQLVTTPESPLFYAKFYGEWLNYTIPEFPYNFTMSTDDPGFESAPAIDPGSGFYNTGADEAYAFDPEVPAGPAIDLSNGVTIMTMWNIDDDLIVPLTSQYSYTSLINFDDGDIFVEVGLEYSFSGEGWYLTTRANTSVMEGDVLGQFNISNIGPGSVVAVGQYKPDGTFSMSIIDHGNNVGGSFDPQGTSSITSAPGVAISDLTVGDGPVYGNVRIARTAIWDSMEVNFYQVADEWGAYV